MTSPRTRAFSCLVIIFGLVGCATMPEPILVRSGSEPSRRQLDPSWKSVLILQPRLTYVSVTTEKEMQVDTNTFNTTVRAMGAQASKTLAREGLRPYTQREFSADETVRLADAMTALVSQPEGAFKKIADHPTLQGQLGAVRSVLGAHLVLLQTVKTKVGSGATWNQYSGAITAGTSTAELQAFAIDTETGALVWRSEVFVRAFLSGKILTQSVQLLFSTFPTKK